MDDTSFIKRGYPHTYIYKPIDKYLTQELDTKKKLGIIFKKLEDKYSRDVVPDLQRAKLKIF